MTTTVPTSMSARFHPFLNELAEVGVPHYSAAIASGIAAPILERKDQRYSLPLAYRFLDRIENKEGIEDLAFTGSFRETVSEIEPRILSYLTSSCTLLVCALRYAKVVRSYNGRSAGLRQGYDHTWVMFATSPKAAAQSWNRYSDWSNILIPIKIFREVLGASWTPSHIALQSSVTISDAVRQEFPNTRFKTPMPFSGFTIPNNMLSWRMPGRDIFSDAQQELLIEPLELATLVKELSGPYLSFPDFGLRSASELVGMSSRTMQRRLSECGTSFRDIVEQIRFERAKELLSVPDNKVIEVALELGYEDPSHFARAFRRLTGQSPRQYQQSIKQH